MGFPYLFEEDFEAGSKGNFDTESDTDSALDYPSYKTLAGMGMEPYSGAYCMRIKMGLGTNDATLAEADIDIADTATRWFRFNLFFSDDFAATANDTAPLLELLGAGPAVTVAFGYKIVAATGVINLGVGGANTGAVPDNFSTNDFERGRWHTIELKVVIQTGGTGTIDLYVTPDGGAQVTTADASDSSLTNIAVTDGLLGLQDSPVTTSGTILIDNFVMSSDTTQLFRNRRYPETRVMTKTGHAFVGPGKIERLTLLSGGGTNNVCRIYDSDAAVASDLVGELNNSVVGEIIQGIESYSVRNGAYVVLSGTGPRALVKIAYAPYSAGTVRDIGRAR